MRISAQPVADSSSDSISLERNAKGLELTDPAHDRKASNMRSRTASRPKGAVTSPKRGNPERTGLHAWHPYYAGFAGQFVADILEELSVTPGQIVLDPMNGSGTTTMVAQLGGYLGVGVELNPAMAIMGRAKDATLGWIDSFEELVAEVVEGARRRVPEERTEEYTTKWIPPKPLADLRRIHVELEQLSAPAIRRLAPALAAPFLHSAPPIGGRATDLMHAALLATARRASTAEDSKNPTWIKPGNGSNHGSDFSVFEGFAATASSMLDDLRSTFPDPPDTRRVVVAHANAKRLPLADSSIDAIVTSPPYLTRIDYAVGTAPELVILGYETEMDLRQLRGDIMGSTRVTGGSYEPSRYWGATCLETIERVRSHPSKASAGYYLKMHLQYFRDAEAILRECLRVLKPGAPGVFVVQDSWYKDVHVQLDRIYAEMALELGAAAAETIHSEAVTAHIGLVNTRARRYRKGKVHEHVVLLRSR